MGVMDCEVEWVYGVFAYGVDDEGATLVLVISTYKHHIHHL